jgi:hypothetical protein
MSNGIEVSISCSDCVRRGTPDCSDCLVSFIVGETPDELVMTSQDSKIVELFNAQGLLPRLRFHPADPQ